MPQLAPIISSLSRSPSHAEQFCVWQIHLPAKHLTNMNPRLPLFLRKEQKLIHIATGSGINDCNHRWRHRAHTDQWTLVNSSDIGDTIVARLCPCIVHYCSLCPVTCFLEWTKSKEIVSSGSHELSEASRRGKSQSQSRRSYDTQSVNKRLCRLPVSEPCLIGSRQIGDETLIRYWFNCQAPAQVHSWYILGPLLVPSVLINWV